jgi:hypothetical protein
MASLVSVRLETVLVSEQDRCMVCAKLVHPMVLQVDEAQLVARFGLFEDSAIFTQDRCTVYSERTIGLEIIVDAPDGTPR